MSIALMEPNSIFLPLAEFVCTGKKTANDAIDYPAAGGTWTASSISRTNGKVH